ncbi:MAG: hypothetical protein HWE14_13105 [Flavobacteriia bacterium]|nr:hypothetical protein [Flavobacteriia bacterium]
MADSPHLPEGLYFWGQNRLGSLVPLLAHLVTYFGISPLLAVSLAHSAMGALGVLLVIKITKNYIAGILVALVTLLPVWSMNYMAMPAQPYSSQFTLWMLLLYQLEKHGLSHTKNILLTSVTLFLLIWVSDASIVALPIVTFQFWKEHNWDGKKWGVLMLLMTIYAILLLVVKNNLTHSNGYGDLPSLESLVTNLQALGEVLHFMPMMSSIATALVLIGLVGILLFTSRNHISNSTIVFGLLMLILTLSSTWVAHNSPGNHRYFALPVTLILAGLIARTPKKGVPYLTGTLVFLVGWSFFVTHLIQVNGNQFRLHKEAPTRAEADALSKNVEYPLIGNYWSVYLQMALNSEIEGSSINDWNARNRWQFDQLLYSDTLQYTDINLPSSIDFYSTEYRLISRDNDTGYFKLGTYIKATETVEDFHQ